MVLVVVSAAVRELEGEVETGEPPDDTAERVRKAFTAVSAHPSSVDAFHAELKRAASHPSVQVANLIVELLDSPKVESARDSQRTPSQAVLVDTLLRLGFPHAMQISPEHLARYRRHRGGRTDVSTPGTLAISVLSTLFHAAPFVVFFSSQRVPLTIALLPFAIGLIHAISVAFVSLRPRKYASQFRTLGQAWVLGPLMAAIFTMTLLMTGRNGSFAAFFFSMIVASPAMLTAFSALRSADRLER